MHEVWEKQQTHEDVRKMRRTNIFVNFFGVKMEKVSLSKS